jgi:hypothetical protein
LTPFQQSLVEAFKRLGSISAVADDLDTTRNTVRKALRKAGIGAQEQFGMSQGKAANALKGCPHIDPGLSAAMVAAGTNLVPAAAWVKTKGTDDEPGYSVLLRPAEPDALQILGQIRAAFEGLSQAEPVPPPAAVMADLCTVYPLMDAHIGMLAWGKETGAVDYDLTHAAHDMRHAFAKVRAITPQSKQAILIVGGDYFHSDDTRAETPQSKHKLDMDGRFYKVLDVGIAILADVVQNLAKWHETVLIRVLRGNHDPHSSLVLTFALSERYRDDPRIFVEKDPRDLFQFQWGKCAIFAHHGDKGKPQQMALYLSDVCPFWSDTRHRHYLTGHVHHDHAKDFGPLRWESLRAFCPPDAYAASMGYGGRRAMQSLTFHRTDGLVLRAMDPIDRTAPEFVPPHRRSPMEHERG